MYEQYCMGKLGTSQGASAITFLSVVKAPALISVIPNGRDLRVITEVGSMLDNKKFAGAFINGDTLCVPSFIRISGRGRNRYASAGFVLARRHHYHIRKVE
jgi:hypothetical protein